ncbi:pilin [Arenicellales bacterium nBUS_45]
MRSAQLTLAQRSQSGFTLIDILIVILIIGIFASIALPIYNKYAARTEVTEALILIGPIKQALTLYHQENSEFPSQGPVNDRHDALGIPRRDDFGADYTRRIQVQRNTGRIRVIMDNDAHPLIAGKRFEIRPTEDLGLITSWACVPVGNQARRIDEEFIKSCMQ